MVCFWIDCFIVKMLSKKLIYENLLKRRKNFVFKINKKYFFSLFFSRLIFFLNFLNAFFCESTKLSSAKSLLCCSSEINSAFKQVLGKFLKNSKIEKNILKIKGIFAHITSFPFDFNCRIFFNFFNSFCRNSE